jgi:hypothetical protein
MGPGRVERREVASLRYGTRPFMAHCDGARGQGSTPSLGPPRTAEDFGAPLDRTVAAAPEAPRWHCVTDNRNIQPAERLGRFRVPSDRSADDLGQQEQHNFLKSRAPRAALRSDPTPRIVFPYTPQQAA